MPNFSVIANDLIKWDKDKPIFKNPEQFPTKVSYNPAVYVYVFVTYAVTS